MNAPLCCWAIFPGASVQAIAAIEIAIFLCEAEGPQAVPAQKMRDALEHSYQVRGCVAHPLSMPRLQSLVHHSHKLRFNMDKAFFDAVRSSLYGGALNNAQVAGLDAIGQAWEQYGDGDPRKLAYLLGTAHHETGAFKYVREIWGPTAAQKKYEGRKDLGNTVAGDGKKFMGRGFVQLTGRRNYADWSKRTGLDLLKEPDLVTQPAVAARVLVQGSMLGTFTGKKLADYIGNSKADYVQARRVINGTDRAVLIAGYAEQFLAALAEAPAATPAPKPRPTPTPPSAEPVQPSSAAPAWLTALIVIIAAAGAAAAFLFGR